MTRICYEALLLLIALRDRLDYAACEISDHAKHHEQSRQRHQYTVFQVASEGCEHPSAVEEDNGLSPVSLLAHCISEVVHKALVFAGRKSLFGIFRRLVRVDRRDLRGVALLHLAVLIDRDNKEPRLLGLIARHRRAALAASSEDAFIFVFAPSTGASGIFTVSRLVRRYRLISFFEVRTAEQHRAVFSEHFNTGIGIADDLLIAGYIHTRDDDRKKDCQRGHRKYYESDLQFFYHSQHSVLFDQRVAGVSRRLDLYISIQRCKLLPEI